jgi:hypothetical protein
MLATVQEVTKTQQVLLRIVVVAVAQLQLEQVALVVLAELLCVGLLLMLRRGVLRQLVHRQLELMVLTRGTLGIRRELWWWHNGTFCKN